MWGAKCLSFQNVAVNLGNGHTGCQAMSVLNIKCIFYIFLIKTIDDYRNEKLSSFS